LGQLALLIKLLGQLALPSRLLDMLQGKLAASFAQMIIAWIQLAKQSWHWNVSGQLRLPSTTSGSLPSEHAVRQLTLPHLLLGSLPCGKP